MHLVRIEISDFAVRVMADGRAVQMERDGAVGQHGEFAIEQRQGRALVSAGRQYTDGLDAVLRAHSDVVGASAAGLDAQSVTAPHAAVVGGSDGDGTTHDFVVKNLGAPAVVGANAVGDGFSNPFTSDGGYAKAAVEEDGIGPCHRHHEIAG